MPIAPTIKLNNGQAFPAIGLGTWQGQPGEVGQAVKEAIDVGYRHLDCAWMYKNQKEIGAALKEVFAAGKVKREDIFITSKIWNTFHKYELAKAVIDDILKQFDTPYIDLMLIHFPMSFRYNPKDPENGFPVKEDKSVDTDDSIDYLETWKAMEEAVQAGKIKSIGVSNFNSVQVQRVIDNCKIKPVTNQVELHPYLNQERLRKFCQDRGVVLTGYAPLSNPGNAFKSADQLLVGDNPVPKAIGEKHGKTWAQVLLRWQVQRGVVPIPKSVKRHRLEENFNIFDFELSKEEMAQIDALDKNYRIFKLSMPGMTESKFYPHKDVEF